MPRNVWAWSYTNGRGKAKVSVSMERAFALRVAVGDKEALEELERHIRSLVEREEQGDG